MHAPLPRHRLDTEAKRRARHRLPVLRAMCEHGFGYVAADRDSPRFGPPSTTPFVAILEDRFSSRGPDAFDLPSVGAVFGKARGVMVVTGEPSSAPYDRAVALLMRGVSIVVVETSFKHGEDWRGLAREHGLLLLMFVRP